MKKTIYSILFAGASICLSAAMSGCTANFDDINKKSSWPSQSDMSNDEQLIQLLKTTVDIIHLSQQNRNQHVEEMVGQYGGQLATSAHWQGANFANFDPSLGWIDEPFKLLFSNFYISYLRVKDITEGEGYLFHWFNIVRVATQHRVCDIYGPIPYSDVGSGKIEAGYDSEQDAYHNMIDDLTASITALKETIDLAPDADIQVGLGDFVYSATTTANLKKWVNYANSLKLRLAVRIALVDEDYAKEIIEEVMTDSYGPIMNNADNAFNSSIPENQIAGYSMTSDWGDVKINATLSTYMNALNDPRRPVYMKNGTGAGFSNYTGIMMGSSNSSTESTYDQTKATYAMINAVDPQPVMLFCAAETYFLLAEAAVRGWYTGAGSAQELYETGIARSMTQHGVPVGDVTTYMTETITEVEAQFTDPTYPQYNFNIIKGFSDLGEGSGKTIDVAWASQDTDEKKIEAIITQKWLANFTMGIEAWCDWRRTGYPRMFPGVNDRSNGSIDNPTTGIGIDDVRMARRLPYPQIESQSNFANYQVAVGMLGAGGDKMSTELWWAKGKQQ